MEFTNFSSPHVHIQSLDSASTPEAFADREVALGTGTITCTDHGTMQACREVYTLAKERKLTPILGLEGYVRDDNCPILLSNGIERDKETGTLAHYNKYYHISIHAQNQTAYEALVKELSIADSRAEKHGKERKPLFTWEQLEKLGQYDLTMTTGCLIGMVQRHLLNDRPDIAIKYFEKLQSVVKPGNLYVELFPHRCTHKWVDAVFITLEGGEKLKFWREKKLKTSLYEDISAEDLAKLYSRGKGVGILIGVMTDRKMKEVEPKQILKAVLVEDYLQNECRPWCPDGDVQLGANKFMLHLAKSRKLPILISDDAHFATEDEKLVQDSRLTDGKHSWKFHNSYHRQSSAEAYSYFKNYMGVSDSEFESMLESNRNWASRFKDFTFKDRKELPTSFYPKDTLTHAKKLIDKHGRMDWANPVYVARLKKEISLLHKNGTIDLLPYFFIAEEVIDQYRIAGELTGPGRGSAAGLLFSFLLGITHTNPLQYELSEDRFLTLDRIQEGGLPDIDMDFPDRDLLTNPQTGWLYKRFGECVSAISTNTMLRLKSSIKDVHRARHGFVSPEIEVLTKKLPTPPQGIEDIDFIFGYVGDDGKEVKGLIEDSVELQAYTNEHPEEWQIVKKMLGIARNKSQHACAYVICNEPVSNFIPLQTLSSGVRVTQYTAPWVEAAGGLKMDFLGLNSLKDLSACIKIVQERNGGKLTEGKFIPGRGNVPWFQLVPYKGDYYDVWDLPADVNVFNSISSADTETVFQLNTHAARQWLRQFNYEKMPGIKAIDSIEAISAFTALDRPGPLDAKVKDEKTGREHNMLVEFANRAKGMPATGAIVALNNLLPETYGVMVYQEQLEKIYRHVVDCDGIKSAKFRKAVAKKKMEAVLKAYPDFIEKGSRKLGAEDTQKIWDQTVTFGQYGFNKSHAICYSVIAYACAFMKYHYPIEWWTAVLCNADKNEITTKFWRYCKKWLDLPDVRYSVGEFSIQNNRIRAPLGFINGVGEGAHAELCAGRPYLNIKDFCIKIIKKKIDGTKPVLDSQGNQVMDSKGKPKFRSGVSALNRGIVYKLIVSGVMDSLFSEDATTIIDKINAFEQAMMDATEELTGKRKRTLPKSVAEKRDIYVNLTPLTRFQMQKKILPIYGESLLPIMHKSGIEGISRNRAGSYFYLPQTAHTISDIKAQIGSGELEEVPMVDGPSLKFYNEDFEIYDNQRLAVAAAAYIVSERRFTYKPKKKKDEAAGSTRTAVELIFDVDGEQFSFVKWPDRKTGKLIAPPEGLAGSLAIICLTRWRTDKPFAIDAIGVVQKPLEEDVELEESET